MSFEFNVTLYGIRRALLPIVLELVSYPTYAVYLYISAIDSSSYKIGYLDRSLKVIDDHIIGSIQDSW